MDEDGTYRTSSGDATADGPWSIVGRLNDSVYESNPGPLPLTPGATTEDETVFAGYTARQNDEIPMDNDTRWHGPSEPRDIPWGRSRMFNQPQSQATNTMTPSILSSPGSQKRLQTSMSLDGSQDLVGTEKPNSPRALLAAIGWLVKAAEQGHGHGGLRNAIHAAERSGELKSKMWVGTLGMPTDSVPDSIRKDMAGRLRKEYGSLIVFVSDTQFEGHYNHFCRTVLWPAFHYQMQESPRHSEYEKYSWTRYLELNEVFANTIVENWKPGDKIWVHDYHLLVLPGLLRERLPEAEIGFYLHTPFPSSEIFRCLTPREQLLDGMLGADLIGFQTDEYRDHFVHSCSRLRRLNTPINGIHFNDRFIGVMSTPMGIEPSSLNEIRESTEVQGWRNSINRKYHQPHQYKRLIVARDRLDTPGGIKQKLLAYEVFLKTYPKWRNNVVLVQVISSAPDTPELEAQVSKIAMRINTTYSNVTHQPLVLLQQDITHFQFIALLSLADIFMATNLRDGMNLTSHEFIHCQDGEYGSLKHGSLILSEFVGSASIFKTHELLVNPWNYKQCAEAINTALVMSTADREANWKRLCDLKSPYTAIEWHRRLQHDLKTRRIQQPRHINKTSPLSLEDLESSYLVARARIFFLEDVATFGPCFPTEESSLSKKTLEILEALVRNPKNILYITSNRGLDQLKETLPKLPSDVGYFLENGRFTKITQTEKWVQLMPKSVPKWRLGIQRMMEYFQERTEGGRIEENPWSLIFHYDRAQDNEFAAKQASDLADQINGARGSANFNLVRDATSLSVEPPVPSQGKGVAASYALDHLPSTKYPEFIFAAGGSRNDEALFRWANELAAAPGPTRFRTMGFGQRLDVTTLTTGTHATEAKSTLPVHVSLLDILDSLSRSADHGESSSPPSMSPASSL